MNEVTITSKDFNGTEEIFVNLFICPACKDSEVIEYSNYCQECGIKLNWDVKYKDWGGWPRIVDEG
jgi:hypothetical protein